MALVTPVMAARAGVHGSNQHEACRISIAGADTGNGHFAVFKRLAQRIKSLFAELGDFVEKEDAVVSQRDLARAGIMSATDQGVG